MYLIVNKNFVTRGTCNDDLKFKIIDLISEYLSYSPYIRVTNLHAEIEYYLKGDLNNLENIISKFIIIKYEIYIVFYFVNYINN